MEPAVGTEAATAVAEPPAPSEPSEAPEAEAIIADDVSAEAPPEPAPEAEPPPAPSPEPAPAESPPARLVPEQMAGPLQTILLAAAQQALDLLQVDATQVFTVGEHRRFVLRAGVPTESLAIPEGTASINSGLLRRALDNNEVLTVEDLAAEELSPDEAVWVDAGYRGMAAIALSPPLERPVGVLVLLRRTPWRLDRRDAVRLEDLAVEAVAALRAHSLAIKVAEVAVLQERVNLAREIHDGLASDLAAVVALFKYYEQRRQRDPDDASQLLPQLRSMTEEDWADVLDTNLRGTFNYSKAAVPLFMRQSSGRIINIISLSVKTFLTGSVLSTSMRMGVAGMAKLLSDEVGPDNITVNNVAPGLILTERVRDTLPPHKPEEEAQLLAERAKSIPVRRIGRPEELGDLVAFLASPLAGYITGATIPIDGGAIRATAP